MHPPESGIKPGDPDDETGALAAARLPRSDGQAILASAAEGLGGLAEEAEEHGLRRFGDETCRTAARLLEVARLANQSKQGRAWPGPVFGDDASEEGGGP